MSIDYLEDLEQSIDLGHEYFTCPGSANYQWMISPTVEELRKHAQRAANSRRHEVYIYRLVSKTDTVSTDSYLVVRKILEPGPRGEPHLHWVIVDTREAAELMRDVSHGPTPYFGAVIEEVFKPIKVL